jgi:hypothetical protein
MAPWVKQVSPADVLQLEKLKQHALRAPQVVVWHSASATAAERVKALELANSILTGHHASRGGITRFEAGQVRLRPAGDWE